MRAALLVCAAWLLVAAPLRTQTPEIRVRTSTTPFGPVLIAETPQLTLTAALSDEQLTPGKPLKITLDVEPARGVHVYAPGKHPYQVVNVTLDAKPWLRALPLTYPASEVYHFKPLDERVAVYSKPFRLTQEAAILDTPPATKALAGAKSVTVSAQVHYQACDDTVCYKPQTIPLSWTLVVSR